MPIYLSVTKCWTQLAGEIITPIILKKISSQNECSIILTGGATARLLYKNWSNNNNFKHAMINYYFGDERCVPPNHADSNYSMVMDTLFLGDKLGSHSVHRIKGETEDCEQEAHRYGTILPNKIDILLLSMGLDGHIASLFPESEALNKESELVTTSSSSMHNHQRITITSNALRIAQCVLVFVCGSEKGRVLANACEDLEDYNQLPVRLTFGGNWLLDKNAAEQFSKHVKNTSNLDIRYF